MKALALALCLAATSCATLPPPQDMLVEFRSWLVTAGATYDAVDRFYMRKCFQHESEPDCIEIDEFRQAMLRGTNAVTVKFNQYNSKIGGK